MADKITLHPIDFTVLRLYVLLVELFLHGLNLQKQNHLLIFLLD